MKCIKVQRMITPFIQNKLNLKDTEEFIDHVGTCKNCKEELEVYYALLTAMKQLDEDKNLSSDFNMELSRKLEMAQERILHAKFTYYRKKAILFFVILILAFLMSFRYAYKSIEYEKHATVSTFQIRRNFYDNRFNDMDIQLQKYLETRK